MRSLTTLRAPIDSFSSQTRLADIRDGGGVLIQSARKTDSSPRLEINPIQKKIGDNPPKATRKAAAIISIMNLRVSIMNSPSLSDIIPDNHSAINKTVDIHSLA
jgi:hypothetical protein